MINGTIVQNQPIMPIMIGWSLGVYNFAALIDTGFTGELKISNEVVNKLGLVISHSESVYLGNDQVVFMGASVAAVSMEGTIKSVNVLVSPGIPIVGVRLLKKFGYILTMDFTLDTLSLQK